MEGLCFSLGGEAAQGKTKRFKYSHCIHATAVFANCFFVHKHVGEWLEDDPYSYFALARTTKRLWEFYCVQDKPVRHMRHVWNLSRNPDVRSAQITRSGLFTCVAWQWNRDCKHKTRASLADLYLAVAGDSGDLRVVRMVSPWVEQEWLALAKTLTAMLVNSHDDVAVQLMENPPWLSTVLWKTNVTTEMQDWKNAIFAIACTHVAQAPKFYAYMLGHTTMDLNSLERRARILAHVVADGNVEYAERNFAFFWNAWRRSGQYEEIELVHQFISFIMMNGNEKGVLIFPLIFRRFFLHLASLQHHGAHIIVFPNGDTCLLTIESDTITRAPNEMLFHIVCHSGPIRRAAMGNVPAMYC
jgi:hypothetical protein